MFFDRLKELCEAKGISVYKACTDIGLNRSAVNKWKNGGQPNGSTLASFARYFGVSVDFLLSGEHSSCVTVYTNGICAYTGSTMQEIDSNIEEKEPGTFKIVFRGPGVVITVDNDGGATEEQISSVIAIYSQEQAWDQKKPTLTEKDRRDIARDLEDIMAHLDSAGDLMFDGDPMSDEARESIRAAMKLGLEAAKLKNKERFTPKKYRKG